MSLGRPFFTPASDNASIKVYTYAGPLPERPVTASSSFSSRGCAVPRRLKISRATATSSAVALAPAATAEAALSTRAGVFGITRTTRAPLVNADSIVSVLTPAMMEMKSFPRETSPVSVLRASMQTCGFTASRTISPKSTASRFSLTVRIPYFPDKYSLR